MKPALSLFLLLFLLLSVLTGCSGPGSATEPPKPETSEPKPVVTTAPQTAPSETEAPVFQEIVLLDSESCAFTVTNITVDDIWGYTFCVRCENRSEATQLFSAPTAACRGWLLNPELAVMVSAGETKETEFNIWPKSLAFCGLETLDELRLHLSVSNTDDYSAEPFADEMLLLYPHEKTLEEYAPAPGRSLEADDVVIADNEDFSFTVCGRDEDNIWTYNLVLYIENKTETDLTFSWKDVAVNGSPTNALWFYYTVPAGLRACFPVYFDEDTMKAAGVEAIETVDFTLNVTPSDSFAAFYSEAHSYSAR